jgi:hypothetical protein
MLWLRRGLGFAWFVAQMYIAFHPQIPMLERTLHVMVAMLLVFLWFLRQIQRITGLQRDDLLNPGRTVRRQV